MKEQNSNIYTAILERGIPDIYSSTLSNNNILEGGFSFAFQEKNINYIFKEKPSTKNVDGCVISNNCKGANCDFKCGTTK